VGENAGVCTLPERATIIRLKGWAQREGLPGWGRQEKSFERDYTLGKVEGGGCSAFPVPSVDFLEFRTDVVPRGSESNVAYEGECGREFWTKVTQS